MIAAASNTYTFIRTLGTNQNLQRVALTKDSYG